MNLDLTTELEVIVHELQAWIKAHCSSRHELAALCRRWGCTQYQLNAFLGGKNRLDAWSLRSISQDTGIPLARLFDAADAAGLVAGDVSIKEEVVRSEEGVPLRMVLLPAGRPVYKDLDFTSSGFWVRAIERATIRPGRLVWLPVGVKVLERENYVLEWQQAGTADLFIALNEHRRQEHIKCLTSGPEPVTIKAGMRLGFVTAAPAAKLSPRLYKIPKGYQKEADKIGR